MSQAPTLTARSWSWKRPRRNRPASRKDWWRVVRRKNLEFVLTHRPYVGMCVTEVVNLLSGCRTNGLTDPRWEFPDVKKKVSSGGAGGEKHLAAMESAIFAQLLPLVEHCALVKYDDGDARVPGWLRLGTLGAAWTFDVKDPDSEMSFRIVDGSLDKAIEAAALLLACDEAPWSPDPYLKGRKGQKKK